MKQINVRKSLWSLLCDIKTTFGRNDTILTKNLHLPGYWKAVMQQSWHRTFQTKAFNIIKIFIQNRIISTGRHVYNTALFRKRVNFLSQDNYTVKWVIMTWFQKLCIARV